MFTPDKILATQDIAFINNVRTALRANPPTHQAHYADDPIAAWKYIIRGIAYGLKTKSEIGRLYGIIPEVCLTTGTKLPNIDAHHVVTWVEEVFKEKENKI